MEDKMRAYKISEVVPSIEKIRKIIDAFHGEYDYFINDSSDGPFMEYSRYMKALELFRIPGGILFTEDQVNFCLFVEAFYNQTEGWDFIRGILNEFDYFKEYDCENCLVRPACYGKMTDERPPDCEQAYEIRDWKFGLLLFIYLKYFKTEKASLIYD